MKKSRGETKYLLFLHDYMVMKVFRRIAYLGAVALIAMAIVSCSNENDTVLTSQQTSISRYLTSSHQPKLIPESEIANALDNEPQFYTNWELDIYRYIATYYDEGREDKAVVERGLGKDEKIIVEGFHKLSHGMRVEIVNSGTDEE